MSNLSSKKCAPCGAGTPPYGVEEINSHISLIKDWKVRDGREIIKDFKFKNFKEALDFVNKVGEIAETEGHHPDIEFGWGRVRIILWTHAINGLSENDFIIAAKIDDSIST